jgi:catechol 2,3-dioxygenase-like lactoylglutathione lyase family enzyme
MLGSIVCAAAIALAQPGPQPGPPPGPPPRAQPGAQPAAQPRAQPRAQPAADVQKLPSTTLADARAEGTFIALSVSDAAASARWYEETLGLRVFKRIDPPNERVHIVLMEGGGAILELLEHPGAKARTAWHPDAKEPFEVRGIFKAGFRVAQLDSVLQGLRDRKVEIRHGPFDVPELKLRSFIAVDPDGNLLQFFGG